MTDFVRKSRPQNPDQPSLFLSLQDQIRLRNRDGWSSVGGPFFRTKSVMGRLWDDHFQHSGHPPKFYRVQDAIFIDNSSNWYNINVILIKNHDTNHTMSCFYQKVTSKQSKRNGPCQECTTQKSGVGMHPIPYFQLKSMKKLQNHDFSKKRHRKNKKHPARNAPHRSPAWGCTKTAFLMKTNKKIEQWKKMDSINHP